MSPPSPKNWLVTNSFQHHRHDHVAQFYTAITPFFCIMGSIFSVLELVWAKLYKNVWLLAWDWAGGKPLSVDACQLWVQTALICNKQSAPHTNNRDTK